VLESLDSAAGFGIVRTEDGRPLAFRLLPYASLWRFGAPGATAAEFPAGLRVRLWLLPPPGAPAGARPAYAVALADEVTEQLRAGGSYRIASQDVPQRQFTVEWIAADGNRETGKPTETANPSPNSPIPQFPDSPVSQFPNSPVSQFPRQSTLGYGPKTVLVMRADPVYTFRVPLGTRLRVNSGFPAGSATRMAMEVLDEASAERFRQQQLLRLTARAEVAGVRGYLIGNGAGGARALVFPDDAAWARGLKAGETVVLAGSGTGRVKGPAADSGPAVVTLEAPLPGRQLNEVVAIRRPERPVDFARDIRPLLAVNCLPCHGGAGVRGGYSIDSMERLRRGGPRGPGIVPGKSDESLLYLLLSGDRNPPMPLDRPVTAEQLSLLKRWIDAGAPAGE
jgi:hypothetical protein